MPLPSIFARASSLPAFLLPAAEGVLFVGLAAVLGAIVGSFLNVVAYRVPLGRSVVRGRSACPACGQPVRAFDNVPVLGWLWLRGRCRDCGWPIPARYARVEAWCGVLVAGIALTDLLAAGGAVPAGSTLVESVGRLGAAWLWQSGLALTLVAWALLGLRGHRAGWRSIATAALVFVPLAAATAGWPAAVAAVAPLAAWPLLGGAVERAVGWLVGE